MHAIQKPCDPFFMLKQLTELADMLNRPSSPPLGELVRTPCHAAPLPDFSVLSARRASGETYASIAADLNLRGIRARYGGRWYSASVWAFLHRGQLQT